MEERLRFCRIPVIARVSKDRLLLDMRTTQPEYFDYLAALLCGRSRDRRSPEETE